MALSAVLNAIIGYLGSGITATLDETALWRADMACFAACTTLSFYLQAWLWRTARFARQLAVQAMPELVDESMASNSQAWVIRPRGSLYGADRTLNKAPGYERLGDFGAPES